MWRYVGLAGVYCRKLCDVFQALQARLWSIQIDAPTIRYCVQIDAIREIAFACDEVKFSALIFQALMLSLASYDSNSASVLLSVGSEYSVT